MEKALSIMQPWASMIAHGIKDIENRTWYTKYRGEFYIHASAKYDQHSELSYFQFNEMMSERNIDLAYAFLNKDLVKAPQGAIIGKVEIIDCVQNHPSIWAEVDTTGTKPIWNWVLKNHVLFEEPILNVKGQLNLWNVDIEKLLNNGNNILL